MNHEETGRLVLLGIALEVFCELVQNRPCLCCHFLAQRNNRVHRQYIGIRARQSVLKPTCFNLGLRGSVQKLRNAELSTVSPPMAFSLGLLAHA